MKFDKSPPKSAITVCNCLTDLNATHNTLRPKNVGNSYIVLSTKKDNTKVTENYCIYTAFQQKSNQCNFWFCQKGLDGLNCFFAQVSSIYILGLHCVKDISRVGPIYLRNFVPNSELEHFAMHHKTINL